MGVFRIDEDGNWFTQVFYRGSNHIEDIHFCNLLKGQIIEQITVKGEELSPFSHPEYFDFDGESVDTKSGVAQKDLVFVEKLRVGGLTDKQISLVLNVLES